jgi:hypothetical protein
MIILVDRKITWDFHEQIKDCFILWFGLLCPSASLNKLRDKLINIRFGKEALELADRIFMGPGRKKIDEYVLREALERRDFALAMTKKQGRNFIGLLWS